MNFPLPQLPSIWSGVKFRGKPLAWYAERGRAAEVELAPRAVNIESFEVWRSSPGARDVGFRVVIGKGASARVLVRDLGAALGCGARVVSLRREAIGGFWVERAWTLDVLLPMAKRFGKGYRDGGPS